MANGVVDDGAAELRPECETKAPASPREALLRRLGLLQPSPRPGTKGEGSSTPVKEGENGNAKGKAKDELPGAGEAGEIVGWGKARPSTPTLREVDLSQKGITGKEACLLKSTLQKASCLTCLKLCYNDLRDEGAAAVAGAVANHGSLEALDLGFNNIGDRGAASLATSLHSNHALRTLYLSGNCIGKEGAAALASALKEQQPKRLTCLHLTGNNIGSEGAAALAEALARESALEKVYLGGSSIGNRGTSAIAQALANNTSLKCLYLGDNQLGDQGLQALAQALQQNRGMELLELGFNHITPVGVERLMNSLWGYTSLRVLRLDNNKIGDRGVAQVSTVLPMLSLELLDLGFNQLGTAGVIAIMKALLQSLTLRSLTLSGNSLDNEAAKAIAYTIGQPMCSLHTLYLDHTSLQRAGEKQIAAGLLGNHFLQLRNLTGFRLGMVFMELGVPLQIETCSNEQALDHVRSLWHTHMMQQAAAAAAARQSQPDGQSQGPAQALGQLPDRSLSEGMTQGPGPGMGVGCAAMSAGGQPAGEGGGASGASYQVPDVPATRSAGASEPQSIPPAAPHSCSGWQGQGQGQGQRLRPRRGSKAKGTHVIHAGSSSGVKQQQQHPSPRRSSEGQQPQKRAELDPIWGTLGLETAGAGSPSFKGASAAQPQRISRYISALRGMAVLPFDEAELFCLHQYYFSPPPNPQLQQQQERGMPGHGHDEDSTKAENCPPSKRQANHLTKTRIAYLPRLKAKVEGLKGKAHEHKVLTILRQLQYLEELVGGRAVRQSSKEEDGDDENGGNEGSNGDGTKVVPRDVDMEAILLDIL